MKKNALTAIGLLILLVSAGVVFGKDTSRFENVNIAKQVKVTVEQARKTALKKVDGKIADEYTIEDEDESVISFVFIIKSKEAKTFEVQIDANTGEVVSSEEITDDIEDSEIPPSVQFIC